MARKRTKPADEESTEPPPAKLKKTNSKIVLDYPLPLTESGAGSILSCGQNEVGQLGFNDDVPEKTRPALLPIKNKVVDVCAGGMHSLFVSENGDVYTFGCNDEGALGRDTSESGSEYIPTKINLPGTVSKISAGDSHSAALLTDGRVFAWGSFRDSHGSMGLTIDGSKLRPYEILPQIKCVDIASGVDHLVLLSENGRVYTLGCAEQGQLGRVTPQTATGETRRGKITQLTPSIVNIKNFKPCDCIWASGYATFVREKSTGNIYAFGLNNYNQIGIKKTGGESVFTPKLTTFENVKAIAGGQHHTLVLTNDNKCYSIGRKDYGRLGLGEVEKEEVDTLTKIKTLDNKKVTHISCGESCSFALTNDGKVYAWGMGTNQQLGVGPDDDLLIPTLLTGQQVKDKNVIGVSSGGQHTLFIVKEPSIKMNGTKEPEKSSGQRKK